MTIERCAEVMCRALGVVTFTSVPNQHDLLSWASVQEKPAVIVVDGLDEAGSDGRRIASDLLMPLSRHALVIVASREVEDPTAETSLLESLGPPELHVDLDAYPEDTNRDVYEYVVQRLTKGREAQA